MMYWFGRIVVAPVFWLIFRPVIRNWKGLFSDGPVRTSSPGISSF